MSVIIRDPYGAILDHSSFKIPVSLPQNYLDAIDQPIIHYFTMKAQLFDVYTPFYLDSQAERILKEFQKDSESVHSHITQEKGKETSAQRKRRKKKGPVLTDNEEKEAAMLERVFSELTLQMQDQNIFTEKSEDFLATYNNNKSSRMTAMNLGCGDLFQELCARGEEANEDTWKKPAIMLHDKSLGKYRHPSSFIHNVVENAGEFGKQIDIGDQAFIIPANCKFLMSSFSTLSSHFHDLLSVPDGYDLIVMDPPWYNKSVKRKKTYSSFDELELCSFPLQSLCKSGGLVCVWVTNNERILSHLKEVLFPCWKVRWVADWFWLKVTKCGEPVYNIRSSHKKPYERLVIGRFQDKNDQHADAESTRDAQSPQNGIQDEDIHQKVEERVSSSSSQSTSEVMETQIPGDYVIVSVPCSLHSKKPPLSDVMSPYLPSQPKCLEMFARNLMPGWTSWGNEVLRHQHTDYYDAIS